MIEFFQGLSIKLSRTCIMEKNKSFKVIIGNVRVDIFTRYFIKKHLFKNIFERYGYGLYANTFYRNITRRISRKSNNNICLSA